MTITWQPNRRAFWPFLVALVALPKHILAQEVRLVRFPVGDDEITLDGSLTGHDDITFEVNAKAGQKLDVTVLGLSNVFFDILPFDRSSSLYDSSNTYSVSAKVKLPADGKYVIRLYLRGENKDEGLTVRYMIRIAII